MFAAFAFVILLGTVFPLISEALSDDRVTVGVPYFERMSMPIGMVLLSHGLFTFGDTCEQAYDRHLELIDLARAHLDALAPSDRAAAAEAAAPAAARVCCIDAVALADRR